MRRLIARHPVSAYFTLTFAFSWGGLLWLAGGPGGIPAAPETAEALLPLFVLSVLVGPSATSILLTGLLDGRTGLRDLLSRSLRWRVAAHWYAVALLLAPLTMTVILLALSLSSAQFVPAVIAADNKALVLLPGGITALAAGVFEELGWTGFAIPRLRPRYGIVGTGLIVGFLWAVWHLLPALWLSGNVSGTLALTSYLLDPFLFLVAFRVLMAWVYDQTTSVLMAMLMHMSLTFGARVLTPQGIAGVPLLTFDIVWAAIICAIVVFATRRSSRKYL